MHPAFPIWHISHVPSERCLASNPRHSLVLGRGWCHCCAITLRDQSPNRQISSSTGRKSRETPKIDANTADSFKAPRDLLATCLSHRPRALFRLRRLSVESGGSQNEISSPARLSALVPHGRKRGCRFPRAEWLSRELSRCPRRHLHPSRLLVRTTRSRITNASMNPAAIPCGTSCTFS